MGNSEPGQPGLGPDLLGVTAQREPGWLARWLKEPDRMLAEKDPLATLLYEQYKRLAMPNMRLGDAEVSALLSYLQEETARLQAPLADRGKP